MKLIFSALFLLAVFFAQAQNNNLEMNIARLTQKYSLSSSQAVQAKQIYTDFLNEARPHQQGSNASKKATVKQMRESRDQKIYAILSPAQKRIADEINARKAEKMAKREERRKKRKSNQ